MAAVGVALVVAAGFANQTWLDRHFLPSWFVPHPWYVAIESSVRATSAVIGAVLVFYVRPRAGLLITLSLTRAISIAIAVALALVASELALRRVHLRAAEWLAPSEEPLRQPNQRLGWTFVPARSGQGAIGGRVIDYSFDSAGYRVRRPDEAVDPSQPAIICVGESVMFGEGLTWEESIPVQTAALLGIQSANLAVHGFGTDQMYLRLETELPHFRQPVAVVALFMTALFGRNLDDDRPHLAPGLVWLPAQDHGRLLSLGKLVVPYRKDETVARGVAMTRDALGGIVRLAQTRGAAALIVVPHFGVEDDAERTIRREVLDEGQIPYVWVEIDDGWRLPRDRHPNAHAAHAIALAVADRLRQRE